MRFAQAVRVGAWFLVGLNLLMALGAIGIFTRMAPAIAVIIERNGRSLQACEEMLASLALATSSAERVEQMRLFQEALERAEKNVTEKKEPAVLQIIQTTFTDAFGDDARARQVTVGAIVHLAKINRAAMIRADGRAQQLGHAGAWGVVFMAVSVFVAGMIFIRSLTRRVVEPLAEIHAVIEAQINGDALRRCSGTDLPQDIQVIFNGMNGLLDQGQAQIASKDGGYGGKDGGCQKK